MTRHRFLNSGYRRANQLPLALAAFAMILGTSPMSLSAALAAGYNLTDAEVVSAVEKAKILAPSIRINAQVKPDEIIIATYKNPKADDKDCKIEAILMAKTTMDLAPGEVPRVSVYFYSSSTLNRYKQVTVTAGDVKAFATGSLTKDELMASIKVFEGALVDPRARIEEHLQESVSHKRHKIVTTIKGEEVSVVTPLDNNLSERAVKFEGIRIAEQAFEAAPAEVKKVIVTFEDQIDKKENQVLAFGRADLKALGDAIDGTLKDVKVELTKYEGKDANFVPGTKLDLETVELREGPFKEERQKILDNLKELTKAGVGFGTKVTDDFMEIESKLTSDTEVALKEKIQKLTELVDKFQENLKGAKEHKAVAAPKSNTPTATPAAAAPAASSAPITGNVANLKAAVLRDPDGYINTMARDMIKYNIITHQPIGPYKTAEENPNFRRNLQFVIDTLTEAGRAPESEKFRKRLNDIKAKYGG